jgi:hypothetical protein
MAAFQDVWALAIDGDDQRIDLARLRNRAGQSPNALR